MSMPAAACRRTRSATPLLRAASYRCWASAEPLPLAAAMALTASSSSGGRGRLPTWVVRMRSVLRFILELAPPQSRGCQAGALGLRFELGPDQLRVDSAAQPAVRAGQYVLAPDPLRKPNDPLGDQFWVLQ